MKTAFRSLSLAAALALLLLWLFTLTACQAPPPCTDPVTGSVTVPSSERSFCLFGCPCPTLTPTPTASPTPTATPTPTPPPYLTLVNASALPPTTTAGVILFSTQAQQGDTLLWQLSSRGLFTVTDRLLDTGWDCSGPAAAAPRCAFTDQAGQVWTTTLTTPAEPLLAEPGLPPARLDLAPDGLRLGLVFTDDLDILDLNEPTLAVSVVGLPGLAELAWAADSNRLAFITRTAGSANLYLLDSTREAEPRQLAAGDWIGFVDWSPDGQQLAFAQRGLDHPNGGNQRQDLFIAGADGVEALNRTEYFEDRPRPAPAQPFGVRWLTWLPDSSAVAFTWSSYTAEAGAATVNVTLARKDGGLPAELLAAAGALSDEGTHLLYSPDGANVTALLHSLDGRRFLWGRPLASDAWLPLTPPEQTVLEVCWLRDSSALVYVTDEGSLFWLDARGGLPMRLASATSPQRITQLRCA